MAIISAFIKKTFMILFMELANNYKEWIKKGNERMIRCEYESAIDCYDNVPPTHPDYENVMVQTGHAYAGLCYRSVAIKCFNAALAINPHNIEALNGKGYVFHKLGRYRDAIECFDQALYIKPDFESALLGKGLALASLDCHLEAILYFDKVLAIATHKFRYVRKRRKQSLEKIATDKLLPKIKQWYNRISFRWPISIS